MAWLTHPRGESATSLRATASSVAARPVVIILLLIVVASCAHNNTAPCFQPSLRPSQVLVPDRFTAVIGPRVALFWITGAAPERPTELDLPGRVVVKVDSRTRLLNTCLGQPPCFAFLGMRPNTKTAEWIYGVTARPGQPQALEDVAVWHVGGRNVIMSSGLSLHLASTANVKLTDGALRKLGTLVSVTFDTAGAVARIDHGACA